MLYFKFKPNCFTAGTGENNKIELQYAWNHYNNTTAKNPIRICVSLVKVECMPGEEVFIIKAGILVASVQVRQTAIIWSGNCRFFKLLR